MQERKYIFNFFYVALAGQAVLGMWSCLRTWLNENWHAADHTLH